MILIDDQNLFRMQLNLNDSLDDIASESDFSDGNEGNFETDEILEIEEETDI